MQHWRQLVDGYDLPFLDEAQRVPNIGINLKILHDGLPALKIIATGSSSFDLGIRNAVIENFNPLSQRNDQGQLWENFLVIERIKTQTYRLENANRYFWRTYTGAELDYVEERDGALGGFEFKFNQKPANPPKTWLETYPEATFQTVNRENYLDFCCKHLSGCC